MTADSPIPALQADDSKENIPFPRYRDNSIDGFKLGAVFDLRVRFAMELLTHSPIFAGVGAGTTPAAHVTKSSAILALDIATELFVEAERRGLVEPFKEFERDKHLQGHVRRQVAFQLEGQKEGMRQQAESAPSVMPLAGRPPFAMKPS